MYVSAILLAAGKGERFNSSVPKPLVKINAKPLIIYSLKVFSQHPAIKEIIIVVNALNKEEIRHSLIKYRIGRVKEIVLGGRRRQDSVRFGLEAVDKNTDLVLIHDAARPFIEPNTVTAAIREAEKYGAAVVGVPVKATIKEVHSPQSTVHRKNIVIRTLERKKLWEIQTPQVFKKDLLLEAYKKFGRKAVTDDASLVERLGVKVRVVMGSYNNIKITTPEDLVIADELSRRHRL